MTTAHRPTFDPARGKEAARGEAYHQRLLPAHKTLKYRQAQQLNPSAAARADLRKQLEKDERVATAKKQGKEVREDEDDPDGTVEEEREVLRLEGGDGENSGGKRKLSDARAGENGGEEESYEAKKARITAQYADQDADSASSSDSDSESEDEEEEDETAQLMAELAKIKAERAEKAAAEAAAQAQKDEEQREKDIALGNPLLNGGRGDGFGVKRRWDDDVVFKNQARGTEERGKEKRFVNDLLRSDFHRRFMDKYVR